MGYHCSIVGISILNIKKQQPSKPHNEQVKEKLDLNHYLYLILISFWFCNSIANVTAWKLQQDREMRMSLQPEAEFPAVKLVPIQHSWSGYS